MEALSLSSQLQQQCTIPNDCVDSHSTVSSPLSHPPPNNVYEFPLSSPSVPSNSNHNIFEYLTEPPKISVIATDESSFVHTPLHNNNNSLSPPTTPSPPLPFTLSHLPPSPSRGSPTTTQTTTTTTSPSTVTTEGVAAVDQRVKHYDGRLPYDPVKYSFEHDILPFANLEHTQHAFRAFLKEKQKSESTKMVTRLMVSLKPKLQQNIASGVNGLERMIDSIANQDRWKYFFGRFKVKLLKSCFCLLYNETETKMYHGEFFVGDGAIGFLAVIQKPNEDPQGLRICVGFDDIVNITTAAKSYPVDSPKKKYQKPVIYPITHPSYKPSVIQIWTSAKEVHQFFKFSNFDEIYNILITAWRRAYD